jgi:hypothetical protein
VRYHVCVLGEAALRLGRDAEFSELMTRYEPLLRDEKSGYWMPIPCHWLPGVIGLFLDLSRTKDSDKIMKLTRRLVGSGSVGAQKWIAREWLRRAGRKLSWWQRLRLELRLSPWSS